MPNNKAVLLSIQTVWCSKIVLKEKTVEVRKTKPEDAKPPFKCYIYCTKERSKMGWLRIVPGKGWQRLDGTVIGEFVCDKIWELAPICRAPDDVEEMACMDRDRIVRYLNKCRGWAWHISDLKIYDQPRKLRAFTGLQSTRFGMRPVEITPATARYQRQLNQSSTGMRQKPRTGNRERLTLQSSTRW